MTDIKGNVGCGSVYVCVWRRGGGREGRWGADAAS
jgi:hypothetical protein